MTHIAHTAMEEACGAIYSAHEHNLKGSEELCAVRRLPLDPAPCRRDRVHRTPRCRACGVPRRALPPDPDLARPSRQQDRACRADPDGASHPARLALRYQHRLSPGRLARERAAHLAPGLLRALGLPLPVCAWGPRVRCACLPMTRQCGLLRPAPPTARRCPTRPPRTGDDRPQPAQPAQPACPPAGPAERQ